MAIYVHHSCRPFIPEIISPGGGIRGSLLSLFSENPEEEQHRPTFTPSFANTDYVDTTLSLSMPSSANTDAVDTTLSLSTPALSINSATSHSVAVSVNSTTADSVAVADEAAPSTLVSAVPINSDSRVYDPKPLRIFDPATADQKRKKAAGKRKCGGDCGGGNKRGKRVIDEDRRGPPISPEEFEQVMQCLESRKGGRAMFLYRKTLVESDVKKDQNRLFLTGSEAVEEFMTEEEVAAVDDVSSKGLRIVGMDKSGRGYDLGMKKWQSLKIRVINSEWNKMVALNGAGKGDAVEIWGFRHGQDSKLGFAFVFTRSESSSLLN